MARPSHAPVISPRAVSAFIHQRCDDWNWLKEVPRKELLRQLLAMRPVPDVSEMMTQQLAGLLLGIAQPHFAFFYGMGTGKTLLILRLLKYWRALGKLRKAVCIVPSQEAVVSWEDECERWKFDIPWLGLSEGTTQDKWDRFFEFEEGLVIISYPSFRALGTEREFKKNKREKKGRIRDVPQKAYMRQLRKGLDACVFDELTEAKEKTTLNFRLCRALSAKIPVVYGLAGRPFGRDPTDLWAQQFLIDRGESLSPTLGLFRAAFFDAKEKYWGGPWSFDYTFRKSMSNELNRHSGHRSLYWATDECVDLPPLSRIPKRFTLPKETWSYYERVMEHMVAARGDAKVIYNDFVRLRQLSSGFLGVANDHIGAKCEIEFDKNPKLDLLLEMIERLPRGCKAVVFHEFTRSGRVITEALRKRKIMHRWLWGGAKNRTEGLHTFQRDPACEVLVCQHQLGSYVLNLQMANYILYFESPVGCIDRDQSERRCWRKGQTKRVVLYDLVMVGGYSVDQRILDFHKQGDDLSRAILRNPKLLKAGKKTQ